MRTLLFIAALLCAMIARADGAASANYVITAQTIDGGGGTIGSSAYAQAIAIGEIAGRSVTVTSNVVTFGIISTLNSPPVAHDDIRSHPFNEAVNIPIALLLENDVDLEEDPLSLLRWDATTFRGGSVTRFGSVLQYSPPADLTLEDQFNYTMVDFNGDISIATVRLVIAPNAAAQPLNTVQLYPLSNGKYLLRFRQNPGGGEYHIQFKLNISDSEWELIKVSTAPDGLVEIEIDPTQSSQGYYRAILFN